VLGQHLGLGHREGGKRDVYTEGRGRTTECTEQSVWGSAQDKRNKPREALSILLRALRVLSASSVLFFFIAGVRLSFQRREIVRDLFDYT
jgi:hypothetical protein